MATLEMYFAERDAESRANLDRELREDFRNEEQARWERNWLSEDETMGRLELLRDEANWRVSQAEKATAEAIDKMMSNVELSGLRGFIAQRPVDRKVMRRA